MDNGLIIENIETGKGSEAKEYNKITVNYTGKLEDGSIFLLVTVLVAMVLGLALTASFFSVVCVVFVSFYLFS